MHVFPSSSLRRVCLSVALALIAALPGAALTACGGRDEPPELLAYQAALPAAGVSSGAESEALDAFRNLPASFVPNAGQSDARVRYSAQGAGFAFAFTEEEALLSFTKGTRGHALALRFLGANPAARLAAERKLDGTVNYLLGNDASKWRTGLPTYGTLVYRDLWPGVDMVFRGGAGRLKYEFILRPGAKVADIRLAYRGSQSLSVSRGGELRIPTAVGVLRDERPRSYQKIGGRRVPVASRFALDRGGNAYGFAVVDYDPRQPLVIDPGLLYSTYLGGSIFDDEGIDIAVDGGGSAYVTGRTDSANFPTTLGAFDTTHTTASTEAFVTKLNPTGSAPLLYSTYLGGSHFDEGRGIAVDGGGSAYVTGITASANFPTTPGAFNTTHNASVEAFVTKLNPTGSAPLLYSTYLGGSSFDEGHDIAVDGGGSAYVTGRTESANFPTTVGAFDTTHNGGVDVFVTKLNPAGSAPLYSTYLGDCCFDDGRGIAVDGGGSAYVTGLTGSPNFPTTPGAFDTTYNGGGDAFVTKLNPAGSAPLLYSTYLGGSNFEEGRGIAVDGGGSAYVTGSTVSVNFPTTLGAFDTTHNGGADAFVTKLDAIGAPAVLTLSPPAATNPTGTSHTVTATVTDAAGQPAPGVVVRFTVTGAHNLTGSCTTGANGQCNFSYTGTVVGLDTITAYADSDNDSIQDPGEPTGAAEKTWVAAPSPCPPGDDDRDDDGLDDELEDLFGTLLGDPDSDDDGIADGNEDADDDGEDDEDEDDDTDPCPDDSDDDGEDDEDEDDEDEDDD